MTWVQSGSPGRSPLGSGSGVAWASLLSLAVAGCFSSSSPDGSGGAAGASSGGAGSGGVWGTGGFGTGNAGSGAASSGGAGAGGSSGDGGSSGGGYGGSTGGGGSGGYGGSTSGGGGYGGSTSGGGGYGGSTSGGGGSGGGTGGGSSGGYGGSTSGGGGSGGSGGTPSCTSSYCIDSTTLAYCSSGTYTTTVCKTACVNAGYDATTGCGTGSGGTKTCLCKKCSDPCGCNPYPDGYACGSNLSATADPKRLYLCANNATAGSVSCPYGCHAGGIGQPDYCENSTSNPCMNNPYNGVACGSNLAVPLTGLALNTLYTCSNQQTVGSVICAYGCFAAPAGQTDHCN